MRRDMGCRRGMGGRPGGMARRLAPRLACGGVRGEGGLSRPRDAKIAARPGSGGVNGPARAVIEGPVGLKSGQDPRRAIRRPNGERLTP